MLKKAQLLSIQSVSSFYDADVLKEFAAKKSVKLGKLLKERGGLGLEKPKRKHSSASNSNPNPKPDSYGSVEVCPHCSDSSFPLSFFFPSVNY